MWDYASAAPYVKIDMNPPKVGAYKDAVFISIHKFAGGVGCPGLLLIKRKVMLCKSPYNPGGGSIFFVSPYTYSYLKNEVP